MMTIKTDKCIEKENDLCSKNFKSDTFKLSDTLNTDMWQMMV
jgi:hypothetical protein